MIRFIPAALCVVALSGCAMFHIYPNADISCVRRNMKWGNNGGPLSFRDAAGFCTHVNSDDPLGMVNPHSVPLDLRKDPELQRMVEDPRVNIDGRPYIRRDGTSSNGYYK